MLFLSQIIQKSVSILSIACLPCIHFYITHEFVDNLSKLLCFIYAKLGCENEPSGMQPNDVLDICGNDLYTRNVKIAQDKCVYALLCKLQ